MNGTGTPTCSPRTTKLRWSAAYITPALRYPKTYDKGARQYVVYAHGGTLFVRGLIPGDKITVYTPSGHLIYHDTASGTEWSLPLYYQNGYIVKVNDRPYKVLNL